ncbi:MAG: 6-carboxytetrahydropterin synthase [Sediminibacterium sp.]|nr:6-carboxytetrahydropterin synthase [Sediminibacterium sp.]
MKSTRSFPSIIRVSKQFTFDMAHALYGHDGLCRNIHGHTYHLTITLKGIALQNSGHPKDGMIIDFSDLKEIVQKQVLYNFDHALVLNEKSPHAELTLLKNSFDKVVLTPYQPTCENLLLDIVEKLTNTLPENVTLCAVRLNETPTSYAEWFLQDN